MVAVPRKIKEIDDIPEPNPVDQITDRATQNTDNRKTGKLFRFAQAAQKTN